MNIREAIEAVYRGCLVECTSADYHGRIRAVLQDQAGKWIDGGDHIRAQVALNEVKRLDELHGASPGD